MSLALSAYKVRTSSTGGIQQYISTGPTPTITSTISAASIYGLVINTDSFGVGQEAVSIFADNGLVAYFSGATGTNAAFSAFGAINASDGFRINDQNGVTNVPAADTLTKITISGGIIVQADDISIASIIGGASSNYWLTGSNTANNFQWIRPIAQSQNLNLLICSSITATNSIWAYDHIFVGAEGVTGIDTNTSLYLQAGALIDGSISANNNVYITLGGTYVTTKFGSDGVHYMTDAFGTNKIDINTNASTTEDMVSVTGNLYCQGNLYVDGNKNFKISHPDPFKKENYWLIHSALEGPEAGIYFRKQFILDQSSTTINLPYYWQWLVDEDSIQVFCDSSEYLKRKISLTSIKLNLEKEEFPICHVPVSMMVFAERKENKINIEEHK